MTEMHHAIYNNHGNKPEKRLAGGDTALSDPASAKEQKLWWGHSELDLVRTNLYYKATIAIWPY